MIRCTSRSGFVCLSWFTLRSAVTTFKVPLLVSIFAALATLGVGILKQTSPDLFSHPALNPTTHGTFSSLVGFMVVFSLLNSHFRVSLIITSVICYFLNEIQVQVGRCCVGCTALVRRLLRAATGRSSWSQPTEGHQHDPAQRRSSGTHRPWRKSTHAPQCLIRRHWKYRHRIRIQRQKDHFGGTRLARSPPSAPGPLTTELGQLFCTR